MNINKYTFKLVVVLNSEQAKFVCKDILLKMDKRGVGGFRK